MPNPATIDAGALGLGVAVMLAAGFAYLTFDAIARSMGGTP